MRTKQHYGNHTKINPLYYFFLIPLCTLFLVLSIALVINKGIINDLWAEAIYFFSSAIIILLLVIFIRQQALTIQKRMIRMEMRLRYFTLTGKTFNNIENRLTSKQIAALRFASDTELLSLVDLTLQEQLPPAQIKKKIKYWKGDFHQV